MSSDSCNMPPADAPWSKTVATRIGRAIVGLSDTGWLEAVDRLSVLERELLELVQTDAERREIRRRICEAILGQISTAKPAPDAIAYEGVWKRMLELGFTNDERRMSMHVFRLMYLIDNCRVSEDIQSEISRFGEEIEALRSRAPALAKSLFGVYERFRDRFPTPNGPGGESRPRLAATEWKFVVEGSVARRGSAAPLSAYDVIVRSDAEEGAHALKGRGPIAHPDDDDSFNTWFLTEGADRVIEAPSSVLVCLRVARGEWKPYAVSIQSSQARVISTRELHLTLGAVWIERDQQVYVPDSGEAN